MRLRSSRSGITRFGSMGIISAKRDAKCKMQNAKCKMQNAKCRMQNAKWGYHFEL